MEHLSPHTTGRTVTLATQKLASGAAVQFPETEDEEPRGAKRKKARGLTPEVDTEEEAVALPDEYEFQPQVRSNSKITALLSD